MKNLKAARKKGQRVNFHWLWIKTRVLHKERTGNDAPCIMSHVIVRFLREYNIKMRAKHRNQKLSKDVIISDLKK